MLTYIIYIFYALIFLILFSGVIAGLSFAPWVPLRKRDLSRIQKVSQIKPGEVFYDLGCGDGRTVFYMAELGAKATGIELSWPLYFFCRIKKFFYPNSKAVFVWGNLFNQNLSAADVVYFFGMPEKIQKKIIPKLKAELKPGARVVSYAFTLPGLVPTLKDKPTENDISVYLYTF